MRKIYQLLNLTHLNKRASPFSQFILVLAINKWKIWIKLDAYFSFNQSLANNKISLLEPNSFHNLNELTYLNLTKSRKSYYVY